MPNVNPFALNYWVALPRGTEGFYTDPAAMSMLLVTSIYVMVPDAVIFKTIDVVPNQDENGGICQRTGKWYGDSQLVRDGTGLLVGNDRALEAGWRWDS